MTSYVDTLGEDNLQQPENPSKQSEDDDSVNIDEILNNSVDKKNSPQDSNWVIEIDKFGFESF